MPPIYERRRNCGRGLARESAISGAVDCGCADAFAGKPAPTGPLSCSKSVSAAEPCGSGLARESAVSGAKIVDVPTPSLASQLPQVLCRAPSLWAPPKPVGAGLLAKALCQAQRLWMCRRLRWQASSYRYFAVLQVCERRRNCGSGLARESAGSGAVDCGCADVFAGKPAPTGPLSCSRSVSIAETVGAGLLAKALGQAQWIVDVLTPSPASQLPQVLCRAPSL